MLLAYRNHHCSRIGKRAPGQRLIGIIDISLKYKNEASILIL